MTLNEDQQTRLERIKSYRKRVDEGEWSLDQYRGLDGQLQNDVDVELLDYIDKIRLLRYWERKNLWGGVE